MKPKIRRHISKLKRLSASKIFDKRNHALTATKMKGSLTAAPYLLSPKQLLISIGSLEGKTLICQGTHINHTTQLHRKTQAGIGLRVPSLPALSASCADKQSQMERKSCVSDLSCRISSADAVLFSSIEYILRASTLTCTALRGERHMMYPRILPTIGNTYLRKIAEPSMVLPHHTRCSGPGRRLLSQD